jgi:phytoene dehydrogenase-like protein
MAKIVIVGAGVSGLTAGIELLKTGNDVTIYDMQSVSGGNLTAWKRKGLVIDNCIHWFTGTNSKSNYYKNWVEIGAITDSGVIKADYLYKSALNGESISLYRDIDKTKLEMLNLSPTDEKEINLFSRAVKTFSPLQFKDTFNLISVVKATPLLFRYYGLSLYDLATKFTHPLLKKFFTDYIGGVFGALALIITASAFCSGNGDIPIGSSRQTAKNITNKFLSLGGKLQLNERALEAYYYGNRISKLRFESGSIAYGDYFIFTGDIFNIYNKN